jgi:hypothetical protein
MKLLKPAKGLSLIFQTTAPEHVYSLHNFLD